MSIFKAAVLFLKCALFLRTLSLFYTLIAIAGVMPWIWVKRELSDLFASILKFLDLNNSLHKWFTFFIGRKLIPCDEDPLTPVQKRTQSLIQKTLLTNHDSVFDDSFVKFSSKEETLYGATQLNSIMNHSGKTMHGPISPLSDGR